jgi:hypothetical protein
MRATASQPGHSMKCTKRGSQWQDLSLNSLTDSLATARRCTMTGEHLAYVSWPSGGSRRELGIRRRGSTSFAIVLFFDTAPTLEAGCTAPSPWERVTIYS